ncbi:uncharacterized protein LOC134543156 [Bacillus rossius redtenbacheri]|uniref:uncharacterized protein LOC134543156 n=1 Tax=Bacillus rossius redtenbacheri TaxID=93214 RepID=UPI002FDD8D3D
MECAETVIKDEEKEDSKNKVGDLKDSDTKSGAELTLEEGGDEHTNENQNKQAHGGDDSSSQGVEEVMSKSQNKTSDASEFSEKGGSLGNTVQPVNTNAIEPAHNIDKDQCEKPTKRSQDKSGPPIVSTLDSGTIKYTKGAETIPEEENNLKKEQLTCLESDVPKLTTANKQEKINTKTQDDVQNEASRCNEFAIQNLRTDNKKPEENKCNIEIEKSPTVNINDVIPIKDEGELFLQQKEYKIPNTGDNVEKEETKTVKTEQQIISKNVEVDTKKKHLKLGSGAIAKRRANETQVFKNANLSQALQKSPTTTTKAKDSTVWSQLSPGKNLNVNTGIKGSRSADELQRGEITQSAVARRVSRESTLEARRYSVVKDSPIKMRVSYRRKSETLPRFKSDDKTKIEVNDYTLKAKSSLHTKPQSDIQEQTKKLKNNSSSDPENEMNLKLLKYFDTANQSCEENVTRKEATTGKVENYLESRDFKTQQNMKFASAVMVSTNKIHANTSPKIQVPENKPEAGAHKSSMFCSKNSITKQMFPDEDVKQSENTFAQKQIDEMIQIQRSIIPSPEAANENANTNIFNEHSINEMDNLSNKPNTRDCENKSDSVNPLSLASVNLNVRKHIDKQKIDKCKSEDISAFSKDSKTQKTTNENENNVSSPLILTIKAETVTENKLSLIAKEMKPETTNQNIDNDDPPKSSYEYDQGSENGLSGKESYIVKNKPQPKSHGILLTTNQVPKYELNKTVRGGHGRLAPIQDEEESKEYILDSQDHVPLDGLDEDVGRGCGSMKSTSCRLYFGVKNYLNQFYDPNSIDSTQGQGYYYTEDDDFEYLMDPDKEQRHQRCCRGFWFRAGVWSGVNLLLVGVIALLVGYLTPPRDMVVGYQDNLEILDRWAIAFNHRLELCRLAGLTVFCCGGLVLLVTLALSSMLAGRRHGAEWRPTVGLTPPSEPFVVGESGLAAGNIPVTEQIKSVQPSAWPEPARGTQGDLSVQMP